MNLLNTLLTHQQTAVFHKRQISVKIKKNIMILEWREVETPFQKYIMSWTSCIELRVLSARKRSGNCVLFRIIYHINKAWQYREKSHSPIF